MPKYLKRLEALSEIYESEKAYLKDLFVWNDEFRRAILTMESIETQMRAMYCDYIFANIDEIVAIHNNILEGMNDKLNEACKNAGISRENNESILINEHTATDVYKDLDFSDIYLKYIPQFDKYNYYAENLPYCEFFIKKITAFREKIQRDIDKFLGSRKLQSLGLRHFLYRPTQKLSRYPMLLKAILKNEENPVIADKIEIAIAMVTAISKIVDESFGVSSTCFALYKLTYEISYSSSITNRIPLCLHMKCRKLLKEMDVYVKYVENRQPSMCRIVLLDHLLLICDVAPFRHLDYKKIIAEPYVLFKYKVVENLENYKPHNGYFANLHPLFLVRLIDRDVLTFFFDSAKQKAVFHKILKEAVEKSRENIDPSIKFIKIQTISSTTVLTCNFPTFLDHYKTSSRENRFDFFLEAGPSAYFSGRNSVNNKISGSIKNTSKRNNGVDSNPEKANKPEEDRRDRNTDEIRLDNETKNSDNQQKANKKQQINESRPVRGDSNNNASDNIGDAVKDLSKSGFTETGDNNKEKIKKAGTDNSKDENKSERYSKKKDVNGKTDVSTETVCEKDNCQSKNEPKQVDDEIELKKDEEYYMSIFQKKMTKMILNTTKDENYIEGKDLDSRDKEHHYERTERSHFKSISGARDKLAHNLENERDDFTNISTIKSILQGHKKVMSATIKIEPNLTFMSKNQMEMLLVSTHEGLFRYYAGKFTKIDTISPVKMIYDIKRSILMYQIGNELYISPFDFKTYGIERTFISKGINDFFYGYVFYILHIATIKKTGSYSTIIELFKVIENNGTTTLQHIRDLFITGPVSKILFYNTQMIVISDEIEIIDLVSLFPQFYMHHMDFTYAHYFRLLGRLVPLDVIIVDTATFMVCHSRCAFLGDYSGKTRANHNLFTWQKDAVDLAVVKDHFILTTDNELHIWNIKTNNLVYYGKIENIRIFTRFKTAYLFDKNSLYKLNLP